ncbi:FUSC family protein, partial [Paraburkholderia sp. SIMBA_053]
MTPSDHPARAKRASAGESLFAFLKSLPFGERLVEGGLMALQAV